MIWRAPDHMRSYRDEDDMAEEGGDGVNGEAQHGHPSDYGGLRNWVTRLDTRLTRLEERSIHNAEDALRMEGLIDRNLKDIRLALADQNKQSAEQVNNVARRLDHIADMSALQIDKVSGRIDKLTLTVIGAIIAFLAAVLLEIVRFLLERGP